MIGADLLRFSDQKIVVFDAESQRLNLQQSNLPYEWAWLVTQRGKILERHQYYLNWGPGFKMSKGAALVTRFQQSWVDGGDDPEHVLNLWGNFAYSEEYLLCGHNILGFDSPLEQLWRRALGRKVDWSPQQRMIDTNLLARAYKMGWKPDREDFLAWSYKVMNGHQKGIKTKLGIIAKELGVEVDETQTHAATYDIEVNAGVLWKLINLMEI